MKTVKLKMANGCTPAHPLAELGRQPSGAIVFEVTGIPDDVSLPMICQKYQGYVGVIEQMTQSDEGFWNLMGPFFASAKVKRDLGVAMSSDESYTWLLALTRGEVVGFCAIVFIKSGSFPFRGEGSDFRYFYALPEAPDKNKISKKLMTEALKLTKGRNLKAVILPEEKPFWESYGFSEVFCRGRYPTMARLT
jgi:hypothetical protein